MQDTKLFETILGLQAPWHIARVALDTSGERVDLWVEHAADARGGPAHGVRQVRVAWAEARSRFALLLERLVIDLILQRSTITGPCRIAGISWDEAWA